jgi:hypothetical protein
MTSLPSGVPSLPASPKITEMSLLAVDDWKSIASAHVAAAETLLASDPPHPNEALYLAGFALEVALKGKICLEGLPIGGLSHNLADLLYRAQIYRPAKVTQVPDISRAKVSFLAQAPANFPYTYWQLFSYIYAKWDNQIRYSVGSTSTLDSQEFVAVVKEMVTWIWLA